jgi:long-subunit fatty acid transport protein
MASKNSAPARTRKAAGALRLGRLRAPGAAALAVCAGVFSVAQVARGDNNNPNLVPLGEAESFLGNAGVGRANDTGAVYYNPAGLAELEAGRISVSGAVYMSVSTHYETYLHLDNTDVPFDASGFVTIPSTYVATRRFGDWTCALSVLVPQSLELNNRLPFMTPNGQGNIVYSQSDSEQWIGLSAAHKLDERWSIGVTVFGVRHEEIATVGFDFEAPVAMTSTTILAQSDFSSIGFLGTLGVSYLATNWLRFGLRAQTAFAQVSGNESFFRVVHTPGSQAQTDDVNGAANYGLPFDFSLGSAVRPADWFTLLTDVSLQLGMSYSSFPASSTLNSTVTLKPTPRFNMGMEFKPAPMLPVRLGLFYNPSANGGNPGDQGFSKQDFYGLTGGVGLDDVHVKTTLGGFYAWSTGLITPLLANGDRASQSTRAAGALLTTTYSF